MTNFEKIMAMSIEEMAELLQHAEHNKIWVQVCKSICLEDDSMVCQQCRLEWLKAEAD